ncbi:hypothetical protein FH972_013070 [Carpinus fangiana]|uniref:Tudor domain-containing protein n=1 Tax=Carpinus fangiana TaxID=176857 RepID=A0A5N6R8T7_9ROSI|nr:hypothetical protein FH972_013070 [Carpinus fangiana]
MATSDTELEEQLLQAGNRLVDPPSSVDELLPLLDRVENCLSRVEQSPTKSMQNALSPSLKALVADKLFRHSDVDVKVAVASCISEITRITAPDAPYDDDQMKDIFQLIVSSFENLSDNSSRSYTKRTSILETVAKVRSCVVMLDLECDALILEMFQNFLKAIRDYHPENVFSSMETIMTLVIEESEDISLELLTPILDSVKKDNEEVLPLARKLAERVLESCTTKVKPYLIQAVKTLGISFDDYSKVVASICQETSGADEQNEVHATGKDMADERKSVGASLDESAPEDKERATAVVSSEQVDPAIQRSPTLVMSNGVAETGEDDSLPHSNSEKKQEHDHHTDQSKSMNTSSNVEPDGLDTEKEINTELKPEETTKKRGRKFSSSAKSTDPSDSSLIDDEVETEKLPENKSHSEDVPSSPVKDPSVEAAGSTENEKEAGIKPSSPKALENESGNVASQSPSGSLPDESHSKKASGRQKKKGNMNKEATPSADNVSKKASEGTSDSEIKPNRRGKKVHGDISNENKTPTAVDASKKESASLSSEAKPLKQSARKVDGSSKIGDGPLSKQLEDKKKRGRGKTISEKDVTKSSAKDDDKKMVTSPKSLAKSTKDDRSLEETPKANSKRKRTPDKEKDSDDYGENLVGSKIKVWWPKDRMFYEGVVDSFVSETKKHKVLYTDGDEETLYLKKEKWELIGGDSGSDGEQATDHRSPDAPTKTSSKKKLKIISDELSKHGKMDASPKKSGSSSKSKGTSSKSDRKSRGGKLKDDSLRTLSKSDDISSSKSKDHAPRSGTSKSVDAAPKLAGKSKNSDPEIPKTGKSKDDDTGTLRTSTKSKQDIAKTGKSKQDTPKSASISKGKNPKSGGKSSANNGTGKVKSGSSSKMKESEDTKENSSDSAKVPESTAKGKSPNSSKGQGSDSKSGKKRRRGAKS